MKGERFRLIDSLHFYVCEIQPDGPIWSSERSSRLICYNDQPQDTLTLNASIAVLTVQISPTNINLQGKGYF